MGNMRGRWSLYQILKKNEEMVPYLLETKLFSKESFYANQNQFLVIRPCYGNTKISIFNVETDHFEVVNGSKMITIKGKESVYHYLKKFFMKEKFYILQNMGIFEDMRDEVLELLVTVHRRQTSKWEITQIVEKTGPLEKERIVMMKDKVLKLVSKVALLLEESFPDCPTFVIDVGVIKEKILLYDIIFHYPKSKWCLHQILTSCKECLGYIPETKMATPISVLENVHKFKHVILKPCMGQWGIGVVKVSLIRKNVFEVHSENRKVIINNSSKLLKYLQAHCFSKGEYIIQRVIHLATINQHIFDIRVMVNRGIKPKTWAITGKIAKVARKEFMVTNVTESLLPAKEALSCSTLNINPDEILRKMDEICLSIASVLGESFPEIYRIGIDIGIDQEGKIWIFEANLKPDILLFSKLADQTMYESMLINRRDLAFMKRQNK